MSSAALAKRAVITPMAGTPCRSAAIESYRLHDEQLPQSPTPVTTACHFLISSTMCGVGGRAVVRLRPPYDSGNTELRAQHALELGEIALGALLAVGDESDGLAPERGRSRRRPAPGSLHLVRRIKHAQDHGLNSDSCSQSDRTAALLPNQAFGGSQSTQAPMAAVTALVLLPIQGGMTAPKPPAGPPAATTRR